MELLELYDNDAKPTGQYIDRKDKKDYPNIDKHFAVSVIFIENSNNQFLIQKTSSEKGGYYSSTGGHINLGETPKECIIREVQEELGLDINNDNIIDLGNINISGQPLRFVFYLKKDIEESKIVIQESEVEFARFMNMDEINKIIEKNEMHPTHKMIYNMILEKTNR